MVFISDMADMADTAEIVFFFVSCYFSQIM